MEKGFPTMNQAVATSPVPSTRHRLATGLHLIGDLYGCRCDARLMLDAEYLENFCKQQVAESHLSIHTWPESGYVTLDVYVCNYTANNRPKAQKLFDAIKVAFNPKEPRLHRVDRA